MGDQFFESHAVFTGMDEDRIDDGALRGLQDEITGLESEFDEIKKLQDMTADAETHEGSSGQFQEASSVNAPAQDEDSIKRSVYVGNVDYSTTPQDLQEHFKSCGTINRITIMVDKSTGHPKGFAYLEFCNEDAMKNALLFSDTVFKERQIKVIQKRKNIPGFNRFRGYRGRPPIRGFRPRGRGLGRPYRGRGSFPRGYNRFY